jgi:hypothetical protein
VASGRGSPSGTSSPERIWETRSQVVAAEPAQEFAYQVGGDRGRWSDTLEPVDGGTRLTESWKFLPAGIEMFHARYGDDAAAQIDGRSRRPERHPATLAAIK